MTQLDDGICDGITYHGNTKSSKREEKCKNKATWIIRKNGREYKACNKHKTDGVLVRKIAK